MKRYILTGTPGCGKTSIIRGLEMHGHFVIGEAATDIIAYEQAQGNLAPWESPTNFIDQIVNLQKQRQIQTVNVQSELQFFDRSPICTYALAIYTGLFYAGFQPSTPLLKEIDRLKESKIYEQKVFFIENLGFVKSTEARKISFEHSLIFEKIHAETYCQAQNLFSKVLETSTGNI